MIILARDPAETESLTLIVTIGRHEWYFWFTGRWSPNMMYYKNSYRVKGR